jgi:hypothetical protein
MAKNTNLEKTLKVRRGRVDCVDLYEVKENELDLLENGESISLQLNFAIFLLSLAFSGILTLCTATFKLQILQTIFLFVTIVGSIVGLYLLLMWRKGRKSIKAVIKTIKDRIQQDIIDEGEEDIVVEEKGKPIMDDEIIKPEG